jgi:phosphoglycolate phosphatase-like HAD superfamily hydrolase
MHSNPLHSTPRLAWLFDVDGTLLSTDGAARQAFAHAVRERFGVEDDLADIPFGGRTEPLILADILHKHGRRFEDGEEARFLDSVFAAMRATFVPPRGRLMLGVIELLERIEREPGWVKGLLTGNMTQMARIKLDRFSLADRFAFGAFGEEAPDRNALARVAVERVTRRYGVPAARCVVVGDTEHDIACARAAGARVIAVATGTQSRAALEPHAPDLLLDDLTDPAAVVEWARAVEIGG